MKTEVEPIVDWVRKHFNGLELSPWQVEMLTAFERGDSKPMFAGRLPGRRTVLQLAELRRRALMDQASTANGDGTREALRAELETTITETGNRLLPYFRFAHLPPKLAHRSGGFARLAIDLVRDGETKDAAELTVALRKLLEGKDAAVRAVL